MPTGLSLCLALDDAGLHINKLAHREQGPAPISSPIKLHRSLLFASYRVFVSPVQPALLPGSPRRDCCHSLYYRSHSVANKAECPKGQTSRQSTLKYPIYADSPKRHETVNIQKTKGTLERSILDKQSVSPNPPVSAVSLLFFAAVLLNYY